MTYGLTAKLISKGNILGFFVVDSDGKQMLLSKDKVYQLAKSGNIINWEVVTDDENEEHLYSKDISLCDLPNAIKDNSTISKIQFRVLKNNEEVGFICLDETGNRRNYSSDRLWDYAKLGLVDGVKAKKSNGKRVLESSDLLFRTLENMATQ